MVVHHWEPKTEKLKWTQPRLNELKSDFRICFIWILHQAVRIFWEKTKGTYSVFLTAVMNYHFQLFPQNLRANRLPVYICVHFKSSERTIDPKCINFTPENYFKSGFNFRIVQETWAQASNFIRLFYFGTLIECLGEYKSIKNSQANYISLDMYDV